jgi:hypothetical protein
MQNVYIGNTDPLLASQDYEARLNQLRQMQAHLESQKQNLLRPTQSATPIWDEIDKLTSELPESTFNALQANEDFQHSQASLLAMFQREQMRMIRPIIEQTKQGRELLESHLQLVKQLKRQVDKQADKDMELWREYTQYHQDKTYQEFLKTKRKKK